MPRTLADFPPLGIVITIIYGASVAERTGLFATAIRGALLNAPRMILTPVVVITGMVSHHASDASYVVVIPLAAVIFAAAGRHPLAGLAAGFAAVSGGYAGNLFPGASDALILGITEPAAPADRPVLFGQHRRQLVLHRRRRLRLHPHRLVFDRPGHRAAPGGVEAGRGRRRACRQRETAP